MSCKKVLVVPRCVYLLPPLYLPHPSFPFQFSVIHLLSLQMGNSPSTPSFDQSFSTHLKKNNIQSEPFTPSNLRSCLLLKRDIYFQSTAPQTNSESSDDEEFKIVRNLIDYVDGVRTYFIHVPEGVTGYISSTEPNLSIVHYPSHTCNQTLLPSLNSKVPLVVSCNYYFVKLFFVLFCCAFLGVFF
jgi:hypothetical protein